MKNFLKIGAMKKGMSLVELGREIFPDKPDNTISNYMSLLNRGERISLLDDLRKKKICDVLEINPKTLESSLNNNPIKTEK